MMNLRTNRLSLAAMKDHRGASRSVQTSFRKLSSGARITQAADDAAALAVHSNLTSRSASQRVAMRNANDAVSVVQTMEGGVNEAAELLTRMRELAVQASSETLASTERAYLNDEFHQLQSEIGRIRETTEFNGVNLLDGSWIRGRDVQVGANNSDDDRISITMGDVTQTEAVASVATLTTDKLGANATVQGTFSFGAVGSIAGGTATVLDRTNIPLDTVTQGFANGSSAIARANAINTVAGGTAAHGITAVAHNSTYQAPNEVSAGTFVSGDRFWFAGGAAAGSINIDLNKLKVVDDDTDQALQNHLQAALDGHYGAGVYTVDTSSNKLYIEASDGRSFRFNTADTAGLSGTPSGYNYGVGKVTLTSANDFEFKATVPADWGVSSGTNTVAASGGSESIDLADNAVLNVSSISSARAALANLDQGLDTMNGHRSQLGAAHNRLMSSIHNLDSNTADLLAASSQMHDADFAFQSSQLSKAQIMQSASQAVLAQGNQLPQMALRLIG